MYCSRRTTPIAAVVSLLMTMSLASRQAVTVFNQDGFGYSGTWGRCVPAAGDAASTTSEMTQVAAPLLRPAGFTGGVFDSTHVWLVPFAARGIVRINAVTLNATVLDDWPPGLVLGQFAFRGAVFDSTHVWLVPFDANAVVRIDVVTLRMTLLNSWPAGLTLGSFCGGVFDTTHVWMVPYSANGVVRIDVATLSMTLLRAWPTGLVLGTHSFAGAVFDSTHVWLIPNGANAAVRFVSTGLKGTLVATGGGFAGGVFDSTHVWCVPSAANGVARIDARTLAVTRLTAWPSGLKLGTNGFNGGLFDSTHVWLVPYNANGVVRIDVTTLSMTLLKTWPAGLALGANAFVGAAFDSTHLWLAPHTASAIVRIRTGVQCFSEPYGMSSTASPSVSHSAATPTKQTIATPALTASSRNNATSTWASHTTFDHTKDGSVRSCTVKPSRTNLTSFITTTTAAVTAAPREHEDVPPVTQTSKPQTVPLSDTTLGVVVLVLGSTGAATAGTVSPTSANKPVSASRVLTAAACQQWNVATTGSGRDDDFPTPSAWSLLPSVIPKDGSSNEATAHRVVSTIAIAFLVLAVPHALNKTPTQDYRGSE